MSPASHFGSWSAGPCEPLEPSHITACGAIGHHERDSARRSLGQARLASRRGGLERLLRWPGRATRAHRDPATEQYVGDVSTGRGRKRTLHRRPAIAHAGRVDRADLARADSAVTPRHGTALLRIPGGRHRARVPATVTHGDYRLRHAYVRRRATGLELFLLHWEMAGWGVPTVDLTHIDLDAYLAVIQPTWPDVELHDLQRLVTVGHVFGHLAAIRAVSPRLGAQTTHELRPALDTLESLHAELTQAAALGGARADG